MKQKVSCFKAIDKRIITEGENLAFSLYMANADKNGMTLLLESGNTIDGDMKVTLRSVDKLYTEEREYPAYKAYLNHHIQYIASRKDIPTEEKAAIVYEKATEVMDTMFQDPEALGNIQEIQPLVGGFIEIVLHDSGAVESLMQITAHDYYTHTHSINVSIYTISLGAFLGIRGEELSTLGTAAVLHDIGKSKVDYNIINKNGRLDDMEFEEMKRHPAEGHQIALNLGITDERILTGIRHHHERLHGGGYPDNLKGVKISRFARIIGVCDVFDALSTKRSYKDPMTSFESLRLMKQEFKEHLDMSIVDAFIKMLLKREQTK
ncbi:HD-GYP domain-containing protein [Sulfuricurvum sp.]|uniref:HD-GYP domain-containing protein n=1 Tax=Sulfuricurvum sp. TaxID=2025608 RepID=UPI002E33666A|nr:HD domain-containing phosphohydrolase [Sulfuricurvum sp.]HEX5330658.1 HD domain-containing phosphohydrolase [Sulfuricurvum sp.]